MLILSWGMISLLKEDICVYVRVHHFKHATQSGLRAKSPFFHSFTFLVFHTIHNERNAQWSPMQWLIYHWFDHNKALWLIRYNFCMYEDKTGKWAQPAWIAASVSLIPAEESESRSSLMVQRMHLHCYERALHLHEARIIHNRFDGARQLIKIHTTYRNNAAKSRQNGQKLCKINIHSRNVLDNWKCFYQCAFDNIQINFFRDYM